MHGDIILLMEGLLGQLLAGADLMKNIKDHIKVNLKNCKHFFVLVNLFVDPWLLFCGLNFIFLQFNVTKIFDKVNRYNDLIESASAPML